jgi:2-aminobenzoate-CoA ligase
VNVLGPSGHIDTFARDNLPPSDQWPDMLLDGFEYPEKLNCGYELTDAMVAKGFGDHTALIGNGRIRTYKELTDWTNRLAHVLVEDYGVKPGNRVLIRSANNPAMVAVLAGGDQGRRGGGQHHADAARRGAWQDRRQGGDLAGAVRHKADGRNGRLRQGKRSSSPRWSASTAPPIMMPSSTGWRCPSRCASRRSKTGRDDVALLGFTSGTTGMPKATMHFHRDMLIIADGYAKEVLGVTPEDVFIGSPPLAFTFGLGGLAVFPLRFGAAATLLEQASPPNMVEIIQTYKATVCFTAPTAYRAMLARDGGGG